ncbi:MAG TPA: hypothetical protein VMD07_05835 [Candidatus Acidoferrales bacterium]|nr:hypothetical protein [Candidatus Acidoferrales bacterium]
MMMLFEHGFEARRRIRMRKHLHETKLAQDVERAVNRPKADAGKLLPNAF